MANLKNIILKSLENIQEIDNTLDNLLKVQQNILKNYSNPVFNEEDKNKLLNQYSALESIGKALYRINSLSQNNLNGDTEKEHLSDTVLKGGISNIKYVWHSENTPHTCQKCLDLNGTEYNFEDEVPQRPHPNCKCYVEIVENAQTNTDKKSCDCYDQINTIVEQANELELEITPLMTEIEGCISEIVENYQELHDAIHQTYALQNEVENIAPCSENCIAQTAVTTNIPDDSKLEDKVQDILKFSKTASDVYNIFLQNKHAMENEKAHLDKYYHAKANCESAELGIFQTFWAALFSISKEIKDYYHKVFELHMDAKAIFIDCMEDLKADMLGLLKAREHGYCSEKVLEVEEIFKNK